MFPEHTVTALRWLTHLLDSLAIPYQLSGGFAAKMYGSPRPLNDIDVDIPDSTFPLLAPHLLPHSTFGPERYRDEKWDVLLMTLSHSGQDIDVTGATSARMTDATNVTWIDAPVDISSSLQLPVADMNVRIMHPRELAAYKALLNGQHQRIDIEAALRYADMHSL